MAKNPIIADYHDFNQPGFVAHIDELFVTMRLATPIKAPRVTFTGINNVESSLRDYRGKFIIMPLWATWCMDCMAELQTMVQLLHELEYDDIEQISIVPITIDFKPPAEVQEIYRNYKLTQLPLLFDNRKEAMPLLNVNSLPATFLINDKGYIVGRINKHLPWNAPAVKNNLLALSGVDKQSPKTPSNTDQIDAKAKARSENFMFWQAKKNDTAPASNQSAVASTGPIVPSAEPSPSTATKAEQSLQDKAEPHANNTVSDSEPLPWHKTQ